MKDVRKLYASRLVVVDEGLRKKLQTLEAKCASLEKKVKILSVADWKIAQYDVCFLILRILLLLLSLDCLSGFGIR